MSQKGRDFQSKPRFGRQKFGGRGPDRHDERGERRERGGRDHGERSFNKKFEGDRADRPYRREREEGAQKPYRKREFGDRNDRKRDDFRSDERRSFKPKERRDFGDRDSRPRNKSFGGDRPYKKHENGKKQGGGGRPAFGDKPRKSFGDKPYKKRSFRDDKRNFRDDARPDFVRENANVASFETRQKLKSDRPSYGAPSSAYLYGVHAVTQALLNPKRVHQRLLCTEKGFESIQGAWGEAQSEGIRLPQITYVEKEDIDRLLPRDAVHQDVLLDCQPLEEVFLNDILISAPENAKIVVLDQVTDPHNVGAILRSAAAFGAIAIVMQKLHAPETTGTLAKSASGAVEHVPLVREVNLNRVLEQLKEAGFFCIGLDEEGKQTLAEMKLSGKIALVLGAEGSGLRRLVAENCDALVKLPTQEPIASLNVSNAAAVALYELNRT